MMSRGTRAGGVRDAKKITHNEMALYREIDSLTKLDLYSIISPNKDTALQTYYMTFATNFGSTSPVTLVIRPIQHLAVNNRLFTPNPGWAITLARIQLFFAQHHSLSSLSPTHCTIFSTNTISNPGYQYSY